MIAASVAFLLSPAMLESQLNNRHPQLPAYELSVDKDPESPPRS
jgi:hypothetical protein